MTDSVNGHNPHPANDPRQHFAAFPGQTLMTTRNRGRKTFNRAIDMNAACCNCGEAIGRGRPARLCKGCRFDRQTTTIYIDQYEVNADRIAFECPDCEKTVQLVRDFREPECHHVIEHAGHVTPKMICPWRCGFSEFIRFIEAPLPETN